MLNGGRKIIKKVITAVLGAVTTAAMIFGLPMTSLASNRTSPMTMMSTKQILFS